MSIYAKDRGLSLRLPAPKHWGWTVFIIGILGTGALLGLGQKNIWQLWLMMQEQDRLSAQILTLKHNNGHMAQQIEHLRHDPKAVEPLARQELGMIYPGEWVYRFVSSDKKQPGTPSSLHVLDTQP
jgi:cell division protein FtsB